MVLPDSVSLLFREQNLRDGMVINVKKLLEVDIILKSTESERSGGISGKDIFQEVLVGWGVLSSWCFMMLH